MESAHLKLSAIRQRMAVDALKWAPKSLYSGIVGWGARRTLPRPLRAPLYEAFANAVGANLDEVEQPLSDYHSLNSFFSRALRQGARDISADSADWVSPCDAKIAALGVLDDDTIEAKGRGFTAAALLADESFAERLRGGLFATLYLSPKDYHRVHLPVDAELRSYRYVPGSLFPVGPFSAQNIDNLFAINERVVFEFESACGPFALVMVGAAGVGNIRLRRPALESRHFRAKGRYHEEHFYRSLRFERGDELGAFELGSTVIICTSKDAVEWRACLGESIRFGEPLATPVSKGGLA